uniref:Uncharacterized protein n=1 Tax=Sphenodon punctatus TaxID=8508 RepID=A0A8D0GKX4_SPHPU
MLPDGGGPADHADLDLQLRLLQFHRGLHRPGQPGQHLLLPVRRGLQWL